MKRALAGVVALALISGLAFWLLGTRRPRATEEFTVTLATPGLGLQQAEQVAQTLEQALAAVKGVASLRSTSSTGVVQVQVRSTPASVDVAQVQEAVRAVQPQLPRDLGVPVVQKSELGATTRHYLARSESMSRLELSRWLGEVLHREVEVQQGVREVRLCGALTPELKVTLDPARLRALEVSADDVIDALAPNGDTMETRPEVEVTEKHLRLRDVATLELAGQPQPCVLEGPGVLVSVRLSAAAGELKLPTNPAVTLAPFAPLRTATFLPRPDDPNGVAALARAYPAGVIASEGGQITLMLPVESPVSEVRGVLLRSVDDAHTVVRVSGPDLEQLDAIAAKLRGILAAEHPRWVGVPWPHLAPERLLSPAPGEKDVTQTLRLAETGVEAGALADGTRIRVRSGTSLEDAVLPDGRPLKDAVKVLETMAPVAILHVDRQRTVELEVGLEPAEALRVVKGIKLAEGVTVTVSESPR